MIFFKSVRYFLNHRCPRSFFVIAIFYVNQPLSAFELSADVSSNSVYSNNLNKNSVEALKVEEVKQSLGLDLLLSERGKKYTASVNANFRHDQYLNDSYGSRSEVTTGVGLVNFEIIESFLDWKSSYRRTRVLRDEDEADVPSNQEVRDVYETGPNIAYAINELTTFSLNSNFVVTELSDPDVSDSERLVVNTSLARQLNVQTSISVGASYTDIIDGDGADEYQNRSLNFGFTRALVRGRFQFGAGVGELISQTGASSKNEFFDINLSKELSGHDLRLEFKRAISDTSIGFDLADLVEESIVVPSVGLVFNDVFEVDTVRASILRDLGESQYRLDVYYIDRDYLGDGEDEIRTGFTASFDQQVVPGVGFGFQWRRAIDWSPQKPNEGDTIRSTYRMTGDYNFNGEFSTGLYFQYADRRNSLDASNNHEEFSIGLDFKWKLY